MSQTHFITPSLTGRSTLSAISSLFVVQFWHSLRFCYLEFDKEAMVVEVIMPGIGAKGFWIQHDFRELSFCGPWGPCLIFLIDNYPFSNMKYIYQTINLILISYKYRNINNDSKIKVKIESMLNWRIFTIYDAKVLFYYFLIIQLIYDFQ